MKTTTFLRSIYVAILVVAALIYMAYQMEWLRQGILAEPSTARLTMQYLSVGLTLVCIPLALKLLHFAGIRRRLVAEPRHYTRWALTRLVLLALPLYLDAVLYFQLATPDYGRDATSGYLAFICLVALCFAWPTDERQENETSEPQRSVS